MINNFSYTDFYILYEGHPLYNVNEIEEDNPLYTIIQKYQMILFTNKGELFGDYNFGGDIPKLLYQTQVSDTFVKKGLISQIDTYIPEMNEFDYELDVFFTENPYEYSDMLYISLKIDKYEINNFFA